ncbi:MAG: MBL fold metallo-hydrolase [Anaerolineae bacterium]|nr:MBL fold metallo-hydrolase [Anaerolineae bacterium]
MLDRIQWLGNNSAFVLHGSPQIYLNPSVSVSDAAPYADAILITQATYENCSSRALDQLCGPETTLIANTAFADCLYGRPVQVLRPWQSATVGRARVTAVPAHPSQRAGLDASSAPPVAFLMSLDLYDIYFAGETIILPDTMALYPDIAILPVRNPRTGILNLDHAVEAVRQLKPRWVIPSLWTQNGRGVLDLRAFEAALEGLAEVVIPAGVP